MGDLCSESSRQVANRLHWVRRKRVHDGAEWRARIGKNQIRRKLQKRNRDECAGPDVWMRKLQRVRGDHVVTMEKEIQIQGSRRVAIIGTLPGQGALELFEQSFHLERAQGVTHLDHTVRERWILRPVESGGSVEARDTPDTDFGIDESEPEKHV